MRTQRLKLFATTLTNQNNDWHSLHGPAIRTLSQQIGYWYQHSDDHRLNGPADSKARYGWWFGGLYFGGQRS